MSEPEELISQDPEEATEPSQIINGFVFKEISRDNPPAPLEWIVDGILPRKGAGLLFGASGVGKTSVTIDLALNVSNGLPWLGAATVKGEVVYCAAEDPHGVDLRATHLHKNRPTYDRGFDLVIGDFNLMRGNDCTERLIAAIKQKTAGKQVSLVIIDTVLRAIGDAEDNGSRDIRGFMQSLTQIAKELDCMALGIHHSGKSNDDTPLGSYAYYASADTIIKIGVRGSYRTLTVKKQRNGPDELMSTFALEPIGEGLPCDIKPIENWHPPEKKEHRSNSGQTKSPPSDPMKDAIVQLLKDSDAGTMRRKELKEKLLADPVVTRGRKALAVAQDINRKLKAMAESGSVNIDDWQVQLVGDKARHVSGQLLLSCLEEDKDKILQ